MKKILALTALALLLAASSAFAQGATQQTNYLNVAVAPEASLAAVNNTSLTEGSGAFASYTGSTSLTFSVRTSKASGTGGGTISFKIANDFTDTSSDTISVAANLTYSCSAGSVGTACSGSSNPIALSTAETIVTFANDVHGSGATASVGWTLANNPNYETNTSYSTIVTYTISVT
jgi:hypothetical protein